MREETRCSHKVGVPYTDFGNVLFNNALNTFYLRLYDVGHMVSDHTDSKRGNLLPPHGLLFPISSIFYMHHPTNRIAHTTAFGTPVVEHWLELDGDINELDYMTSDTHVGSETVNTVVVHTLRRC